MVVGGVRLHPVRLVGPLSGRNEFSLLGVGACRVSQGESPWREPSPMAQWQRIRLLIGRLEVRVLLGEPLIETAAARTLRQSAAHNAPFV